MRILMAVPKYPFPIVGGLERQAHELAKALVQRGHAVHALSNRFDVGQNKIDLIDGVRVHRIKWLELKPARFALVPFAMARILFKLRSQVDLVHVHNISWFGVFMTLICKVMGLPLITKLPNFGDSGIPGIRRGLFGSLRIALLKRSEAIVALTPESISELTGIGYSTARVLKVANGISVPPIKSMRSHRTPSKTVTAIFVGRLSPEKGLSDLLHSWVTVKSRVSRRAKLRILGDGPQADELRTLTSALALEDSVEFFGHCTDVPAELATADLFVLPSYAEGNSNAILEAMRAGLPVVATNVGGAAIQVGGEGERFLVAPGNRCGLAARLLELIESETLRQHLGALMRDRVALLFDIDRIATTYEQAYKLIIGGRHDQIGEVSIALSTETGADGMTCK